MSNHAKDIRKQLRNVFQEHLQSEAGKEIVESSKAELNKRLDAIETYVNTKLEAIDKRSKAVQGFLVQTVQTEIQAKIADMEDLIDASVDVLQNSGINIPDFREQVRARAPEVRKAKIEQADAEMRAKNEAHAAAAEAAKQAAEQPAAESPAST